MTNLDKLNQLVSDLLSQSYLNQNKLARFKRIWAKQVGTMPRTSDLLACYKKLLQDKKASVNPSFEKLLRLKKTRSLSGIVPVAVLTKPYPCPGKCVYCPTQEGMPKSYLNDEPAVMRAHRLGFDPYLQVQNRLEQLQLIGHTTDKVELIVMGGTFSSLPKNYQVDFITQCYAACNKTQIKSSKLKVKSYSEKLKMLEEQQKINETAKNRIVGLTIETRPDHITEEEIKLMRQLGCTRVEIGVQSIYDEVLTRVERGHLVQDTIKATRLLKDAGLKVCYHLMPNLPLSNPTQDFLMFQEIFQNASFMPDMLKIYPCVVLFQSQLYHWYKKGKHKPYPDKQLVNLLVDIKKIVPPWVRINRLGRDIPIANIAAGSKLSNIRQVVAKKMIKEKVTCQCIRCREVRDKQPTGSLQLVTINYPASLGEDYFLQFVDTDDKLYAMLRLRIPSQVFESKKHFMPELQQTAIVRELHTYGKAVAIGNKEKATTQHQGLGKQLLAEAEKLTKTFGLKKLAIISGIGAREYYRKLGYHLKDTYMVKSLH